MIQRLRRLARDDRGVVLPLVAGLLVFMMGAAAFGVDLGWLYLNASRIQKAADAASLAGVAHMPLPPQEPDFATSTAYNTALDMAALNGYENGGGVVVQPEETSRPNELKVAITAPTRTFFLKVFGNAFDPVDIRRESLAEFVPPLKLGSDQPRLGNDPDRGIRVDYWLAVNGEYTAKQQGDPYSTRCFQNTSGSINPRGNGSDCDNRNGPGGDMGAHFRTPAYWYAIEVPAASAGLPMDFDVYDAGWFDQRFDFSDRSTGEKVWFPQAHDTTFTLFAPDDTPNNPTDNTVVVCSYTFQDENDPALRHPYTGTPIDKATYQAQFKQQWNELPGCDVGSLISGVYIIAVSASEGSATNGFSLRADVAGGNVSIYGIGQMSLRSNRPGGTATFQTVQVSEIYQGKEIILTLYDPGEAIGNAFVEFTGDALGFECDVRVRAIDGSLDSDWGPDDNGSDGRCKITTTDSSGSLFNGKWLDLRFSIPRDWSCPTDCWFWVDYDYGGASQVTDRTTWIATIDGQPIHLLP